MRIFPPLENAKTNPIKPNFNTKYAKQTQIEPNFSPKTRPTNPILSAIAPALRLKKARVNGVRAWMLIDLALSTGLRVSEMAALKIKDVDLKRGCISVIRMKRKKKVKETMALGKDLAKHLKAYIVWTERKSGALFVGSRGTLTAQGLQRIWKRSIKLAGLPPSITP